MARWCAWCGPWARSWRIVSWCCSPGRRKNHWGSMIFHSHEGSMVLPDMVNIWCAMDPINLAHKNVLALIWVNYNELTTSSLEIIVSKGNHPQMALIQISELLLFTQINIPAPAGSMIFHWNAQEQGISRPWLAQAHGLHASRGGGQDLRNRGELVIRDGFS